MNKTTNSLLRFAALALSIAGGIILFLSAVMVVVPVIPILIGSFLGIGLLVMFLWGGTRLIGFVLFGDDPEYQEWVRRADPWIDTLPPPFRAPNEPERVAAPYQCKKCDGPMEVSFGICPHCNYGAGIFACPNCNASVIDPATNGCDVSQFITTGVRCSTCSFVVKIT